MATFITNTKEREIKQKIREINALSLSSSSIEIRRKYNEQVKELVKQLNECRKTNCINNKVQNSVEFARANGVSEERIFHNNNELKAWLRG